MKKISLFLSIILLSFSFLSAQFEGKVTMKSSTNSEEVTFLLKEGLVKIVPDLGDENAAMVLMNGESGDLTIIIGEGEEKMGMKMNLNSNSIFATQMRMAMDRAEEEGKSDVKLNWTGVEKTVNGKKCEKVTGSNSDGEFTAWVAKGMGLEFTDLFPINSPMTDEMKTKMFGEGGFEGFPMQIISKDSDGTEQIMDAIVEETSISNAEMGIDENLEILDMDNFIQEIMAAQDDPGKMKEIQQKMERFQKMMGGN